MSNSKKEFHSKNVTIAEGLSDQYAPVDTRILLTPFLNKGWVIKNNRRLDNRGGKHIITLNHPDYLYQNGDSLNIQCLNSYDGSTALMLMGGYGRIACANGLILGDMEGGRFIHRGLKIYDKIEHSYDTIVAHLDKLKKNVEQLQALEITETDQESVTKAVLSRLFEKETKKYKTTLVNVSERTVKALNRVIRDADKGEDAFTRLNVLQEHIVRRGRAKLMVKVLNKETNQAEIKYLTKGGNEGKFGAVAVNKIITEEYLKLVG